MNDTLFMTPNERAAYAARLRRLIIVERPQAQERCHRLEAVDEELDDADDDLRDIESAVLHLERLLAQAQLISAEEARNARYVRLSSRVVVRTSDGAEVSYQIDGPFEHDPRQAQYVTLRSPIARALMGRHPGDIVTVESPVMNSRLEIIRVDQSPDI